MRLGRSRFIRPIQRRTKRPDCRPGPPDPTREGRRSILMWTRRTAIWTSLVLVRLFVSSPIWKRHCQMSGSLVAVTLYSTPL